MNQQNPNNPVRRTVQPCRAGGQAGISGGQLQVNTRFGFEAPQQQQPQPPQWQLLYGQENPYIMPTQPVADQQSYQSVFAAGQLSKQFYHSQQSVVQPGMAQVAPAASHEQQWANPTYTNAPLGQRAGAYLIDALIIGLVRFVIYVISVGGGSAIGNDEAVIGGMIINAILMFILGFAYKVCPEGAMGQTLGKKTLGLCLITTDGRPMGLGHTVKRNINLLYSLVPFIGSFAAGIAHVVCFFSVVDLPYNQGYHDRWGNTRPIKEHQNESVVILVTISSSFMMSLVSPTSTELAQKISDDVMRNYQSQVLKFEAEINKTKTQVLNYQSRIGALCDQRDEASSELQGFHDELDVAAPKRASYSGRLTAARHQAEDARDRVSSMRLVKQQAEYEFRQAENRLHSLQKSVDDGRFKLEMQCWESRIDDIDGQI